MKNNFSMARVVLNQPSTRIENEVAIKRKIWFKAATLNSCAVVTYLIISIGMTFYQRSCLTVSLFYLVVILRFTVIVIPVDVFKIIDCVLLRLFCKSGICF